MRLTAAVLLLVFSVVIVKFTDTSITNFSIVRDDSRCGSTYDAAATLNVSSEFPVMVDVECSAKTLKPSGTVVGSRRYFILPVKYTGAVGRECVFSYDSENKNHYISVGITYEGQLLDSSKWYCAPDSDLVETTCRQPPCRRANPPMEFELERVKTFCGRTKNESSQLTIGLPIPIDLSVTCKDDFRLYKSNQASDVQWTAYYSGDEQSTCVFTYNSRQKIFTLQIKFIYEKTILANESWNCAPENQTTYFGPPSAGETTASRLYSTVSASSAEESKFLPTMKTNATSPGLQVSIDDIPLKVPIVKLTTSPSELQPSSNGSNISSSFWKTVTSLPKLNLKTETSSKTNYKLSTGETPKHPAADWSKTGLYHDTSHNSVSQHPERTGIEAQTTPVVLSRSTALNWFPFTPRIERKTETKAEDIVLGKNKLLKVSIDCSSNKDPSTVHVISDWPINVDLHCKSGFIYSLNKTDSINYKGSVYATGDPRKACIFKKNIGTLTSQIGIWFGWGKESAIYRAGSQYVMTCNYNSLRAESATHHVNGPEPPSRLHQNLIGTMQTLFTLEVVDILGRPLTDPIPRNKIVQLRGTLKDLPISQGLKAVKCDTIIGEKSQILLQAGCGMGTIFKKNEGFVTKGARTLSPYFKTSMLGTSGRVRFTCSFSLCEQRCDGTSCKNE